MRTPINELFKNGYIKYIENPKDVLKIELIKINSPRKVRVKITSPSGKCNGEATLFYYKRNKSLLIATFEKDDTTGYLLLEKKYLRKNDDSIFEFEDYKIYAKQEEDYKKLTKRIRTKMLRDGIKNFKIDYYEMKSLFIVEINEPIDNFNKLQKYFQRIKREFKNFNFKISINIDIYI